MPWFFLILAGLLEIVWSLGLKASEGFTRPLPSIITVATFMASLLFLGLAAKHLPISTAYTVFVGIGAAGAAIGGILLYGEAVSAGRIFFLCLLIVSVMGLQMTTPTS